MAFINQAQVYAPYAPPPAPVAQFPPALPALTFQPQGPAFAPVTAAPAAPAAPLRRRIQYTNGVIYEGEVSYIAPNHPIPQGKGTKWFPAGERYEGNFWNDQCHGYGEMYYPNGDYYKGWYEHNKRHGLGNSYRTANQRNYVGGHVQDREEGVGCLTVVHPPHEGGTKKYDGDFVNGIRHGHGRLRVQCPDGTTAWFEGPWNNGLLHGNVRFTYHGVDRTMQYVNGLAQGYGQEWGWGQGNQGWGMTGQYGVVAH